MVLDEGVIETEWPTWGLVVAVYAFWGAGLALYGRISLGVVLPWLVVATAWFLSLQHELVHDHPTRNRQMNRYLGLLPLAVWYPFDVYRRSHLTHHRDVQLTLPGLDPESNYFYAADFAAKPTVLRWALQVQRTVMGRFLLGPGFAICHLLRSLFRAEVWRSPGQRWSWVQHGALLAALLWSIQHWVGMPAWLYLLGVAYPALGLAMLRSFYEHRPAKEVLHRIVVNEASWFWCMLYLNNNYHSVHHALPNLAWYKIAQEFRTRRAHYLQGNGGFHLRGYLPLIRQHVVSPIDSAVFPVSLPVSLPVFLKG